MVGTIDSEVNIMPSHLVIADVTRSVARGSCHTTEPVTTTSEETDATDIASNEGIVNPHPSIQPTYEG